MPYANTSRDTIPKRWQVNVTMPSLSLRNMPDAGLDALAD
jgi:hypothetical protein